MWGVGRRLPFFPRVVSVRTNFHYRYTEPNEGKPNFTYIPAAKDIEILSDAELQKEIDLQQKGDIFDVEEQPTPVVVDEAQQEKEFYEFLKEPRMAHYADMAAYDYRVTEAQRFGSFKHRVQVAVTEDSGRSHRDLEEVEELPLMESRHPHLDYFEFSEPAEDLSQPKVKIQANLYDRMQIEEDEDASYQPSLSEEYNAGNIFYAKAHNDANYQRKAAVTEKKLQWTTRFPEATKRVDKQRELWARHAFDEEALEQMIPEEDENLINLKSRSGEKIDYSPREKYISYEDLVNDMLAKLLPEDGFLRLEPAWKYHALEMGHKSGYNPVNIEPTSSFHFPEGLMVMRVAKFLKVRDQYLDPVECSKEIERIETRAWFLKKYYGRERSEKEKEKIAYLRDGTKERFLLINLRFGTFSVARFDEPAEPSENEWNPDIERNRNAELSKAEILEKAKHDPDYADMPVYRLPPEWILACKKTKFPVQAGTGLTAPERLLHGRMKILDRMQRDDTPLRADMSEMAQNLPYQHEPEHPLIPKVLATRYYEAFPDSQRLF